MIFDTNSEHFVNSIPRQKVFALPDRCYVHHQKSVELALLISDELERFSNALDSLSGRLSQTSVGYIKDNAFSGTIPKDRLVLLKVDGSLFNEGEEIGVLNSYTQQLKLFVGCFSEVPIWFAAVNVKIKDSFPSPIYDLPSNLLLVQNLQILTHETAVLRLLLDAYKSLRKCLGLLECIDFQLLTADYLRWTIFLPRTLQVISDLIRESVKLTRLAAESGKSNDGAWQALRRAILQFVPVSETGSRNKDFLEE